jgi:hypothetical protein
MKLKKSILIALAVLTFYGGMALLVVVHAQDQNNIPGVHTLQVTIGSGTTQVSTTSKPVKQLFIQNNAAHTIRVGDVNTTSSRGALISSGSPGGSITSGAFGIQTATDLNQWFINGTQNDVIDVVYIQ